jgi:ACT domain-containing protein
LRVIVDLGLEDVPGTLVKALEPISSLEGNIVGVVHHHDKMIGGRIIVNLIFEVSSQSVLERLKEIWEEGNVDIVSLGPMYETFPMEFLLVGNIPPSEMREIADGLESLEDMDSMDIRLAGSSASDERSALVFGKVRTRRGIERMETMLRARGKESGFLVIRGLGD